MFTVGCGPIMSNSWEHAASPYAVVFHGKIPAVSAGARTSLSTKPRGGPGLMTSLLEMAAVWIVLPTTVGVVQFTKTGGFPATTLSEPGTTVTPGGMAL